MSTTSTRPTARTGEALSEDAVRRVLRRRRRAAAATSAADTPGGPGARPGGATASPVTRAEPLRRWSVAELIARAIAAPSTAPVRH